MDLRIERTLENIENTFLELLSEKEFPEITVTEITRRARINRTTFYNHFEDKYQLRDRITERLVQEFAGFMEIDFLMFDDVSSAAYYEVLKTSLLALKSRKELYQLFWSRPLLGRSLFEEMIEAGAEKMEKAIRTNPKISPAKKARADWYARLLLNNLLVSTRWWFSHDEISADEITEMVQEHMKYGTIPTLMK